MTIPGATREEQLEHDLCDGTYCGDVARVTRAIRDGADVSKYGGRAVNTAACMGHGNVLRVLLDAGATAMDTSMTGSSALRSAAFYGRLDAMRLLIAAAPGFGLQEALCGAACEDRRDAAKLLLDSGASASADNSDALFWAIINDARAVIPLLIEAGADVSAVNNRTLDFAKQRFRNSSREVRATLRWIEALETQRASEVESGQLELMCG